MSRMVRENSCNTKTKQVASVMQETNSGRSNKGECSYNKHTKPDVNTQQESTRVSCLFDTYYPDAFGAAVGAGIGAVTLRASCISTGIMVPAHNTQTHQ